MTPSFLSDRSRGFGWGLALVGLLLCGCSKSAPIALGEPFNMAESVPLGRLLAEGLPEEGTEVVVSGRIGEVCASAGCWFVLQDTTGGHYSELYVDLKAGAEFTLSASYQGRDSRVVGTLVGRPPDLELRARGMSID